MEKPINKQTKIAWQSLENSSHIKKSSDWFWALWVVAIGAVIVSFYFGNVLFGIIITLFAITSGMMVNKKPDLHTFEISRKGVRAGSLLYPFSNLESFWVEDTDYEDKIIFRTKKTAHTFLIIPFDSINTDPEIIRDFLLDYLDEEELEEPLHQKFMEFLGF